MHKKLAALHKIRKPSTSAGITNEAIISEGYKIVKPTTSMDEGRDDLQGPPPGDSSLIIDGGDLEGDSCAKVVIAVMNKASTSQPARANVAKSTPNCGGHSSSRDSVVCQLCDKPFHTASECYKRFKKGFKTKSRGDLQGPSSGNSPLAILTPSGHPRKMNEQNMAPCFPACSSYSKLWWSLLH
ncbi:hypothetical protein MKW94_015742 [Papaver nudicaule]|uniref:Uncharacterized protein n=1 Tax=Papaver nudicaule TaxID=74823 RepID=A0AA41RZA3_PAPNU|nr:hypothetical protein [Papaver nudicaule]